MGRGNIVFSSRLKALRLEHKLSQKQLGIKAGIDEFVASTRINRYEQAVHTPDYSIVQMLAAVLNVPVAYFYTEQDDIAELLVLYFRMNKEERQEILTQIKANFTKSV